MICTTFPTFIDDLSSTDLRHGTPCVRSRIHAPGFGSSEDPAAEAAHLRPGLDRFRAIRALLRIVPRRVRRRPARVCDEDRKSTRLNSSHLVISYAVFCLKKKNKNTISYQTR